MKIKLLLTVIVAALFLTVPDFSHAQKRKAKKPPTQTKKTTKKVAPDGASGQVEPSKTEWKKFTSQQGQFSVLFPFEPQLFQQDSARDLGKITQFVYSAKEDSGNVVYAVLAQTPYPTPNFEDDDESRILQLLEQSFIPVNSVSKSNISISGLPGVEWATHAPASFPEGWVQYGRAYRDMKTRRLYAVTFSVNGLDRAKKFLKNANKFTDSFKLF